MTMTNAILEPLQDHPNGQNLIRALGHLLDQNPILNLDQNPVLNQDQNLILAQDLHLSRNRDRDHILDLDRPQGLDQGPNQDPNHHRNPDHLPSHHQDLDQGQKALHRIDLDRHRSLVRIQKARQGLGLLLDPVRNLDLPQDIQTVNKYLLYILFIYCRHYQQFNFIKQK